MTPKEALRAVNDLLRFITYQKETTFAGKLTVMGGDFRQVLPILKSIVMQEQQEACIKHSHLWQFFKVLFLTTNLRNDPGQAIFSDYLLSIGNGEEPFVRQNLIRLPPELLCQGALEVETFGEINPYNLNYLAQ